MSQRHSRFTKAEVSRAIQAAQERGAGPIRLLTDGTICIEVQAAAGEKPSENDIDDEGDITL